MSLVLLRVLSSKKVFVLEDSQEPIHKSLSLTTESSKIIKDFAVCKQSVVYDHTKSINSVTAAVHENMAKNGLLTDVRYYLLIYVNNVEQK